MKLYIAYGSNMDEKQMSIRCPQARLVGTGTIEGWELLFKGSRLGSFATIEPKEGGKVPVLVWKISENDEESLDSYEGFPSFYYKKQIAVKMNEGDELSAMVYIMDEKRELGIPSKYYLGVLGNAYIKFGFDNKILEEALNKSKKAVYGNE